MKFLVLVFALIACVVARPSGHGWAPAPAPVVPQGPPQVIHVIRETVQAAPQVHAAPPRVYHVKLVRQAAPQLQPQYGPPPVQQAPPQVIHVQLQHVESQQFSAPPAQSYGPPAPQYGPPAAAPRLIKVIAQNAPAAPPPPQASGGWW